MLGIDFQTIGRFFNWLRFRIGGITFPLLEPFFRIAENRDSGVKKHFDQALRCVEKKNLPVALLNLNMVLSLNPNHFLARVYRGRIFLREGRFTLASKDYLKANEINAFRFVHYDLYREYFRTVNQELGDMGSSIGQNFKRAFEVLRHGQESQRLESDQEKSGDLNEPASSVGTDLEEEVCCRGLDLSKEEKSKFKQLGPITRKEIEGTDWDQLINELSSR